MAKIRTLQIYRGTTAQNNAYTGSAGELTMDTTTNELRLHDGSTVGGHIIGSGSGGYHPDLFDCKWADHILNDVQWLRADTFSWQSGAVYQAAYQHLTDDIDGKTLQSETVGGTTIQFYLADDGHKICPASEESNVMAIYNATGVAWYYILDTANTRFKLPRTQFGVTGLRDIVGKYVEAGLPNITGAVTNSGNNDDGPLGGQGTGTGAFQTTRANGNGSSGENSTGNWNFDFDASRSSSIYGNSTTVQPKATQMYLYFYVGNFTQTALENTAGVTTEVLNDKVDKGHQVVEFQEPTSANNYTWYRKYADGWVEQGGIFDFGSNSSTGPWNVTLPVAMADTMYTVNATSGGNTSQGGYGSYVAINNAGKTTATFGGYMWSVESGGIRYINWEVKGMAA